MAGRKRLMHAIRIRTPPDILNSEDDSRADTGDSDDDAGMAIRGDPALRRRWPGVQAVPPAGACAATEGCLRKFLNLAATAHRNFVRRSVLP
jgi:hypothetical protein